MKNKQPAQPKKPRGLIKRDEFGCIEGTISARVNSALTDEWKNDTDIAAEASIELKSARGRLYYATANGVIEHRRLLQYRRVPGN